MPNIRTYTNTDDKVQPSETGVRAYEQVGNTQQRLAHVTGGMVAKSGQQIGSGIAGLGSAVDDFVTQQDISRMGPLWAATTNTVDQKWNEAAKQPGAANDPALAQRFKENVYPELQKFIDGAHTEKSKNWAQ